LLHLESLGAQDHSSETKAALSPWTVACLLLGSLSTAMLGLGLTLTGQGWGPAAMFCGFLVFIATCFWMGDENAEPPASTRLPPEQIPPWFRERMEANDHRIY